jgi:type IV secretion system protein VirB10
LVDAELKPGEHTLAQVGDKFHLLMIREAGERPAAGAPAAPGADQKTATAGQAEGAPLDPGSLLNMQDRKVAFVNGTVDRKTTSPDRLENPASRYVVQAGSVIPAALVTGLRSPPIAMAAVASHASLAHRREPLIRPPRSSAV